MACFCFAAAGERQSNRVIFSLFIACCAFAAAGERQSNRVFFLLCVVGNGQIKDEEIADNIHKTNLYPPLRKGRLGGDDCTKRLPTACLQIINSLLYGHPLLRLPFPRGGYQLAFPLIVPYLSLPTVNLPAAEKILCYSVFYPQQPSSRKPSAAEKILCYSVFNPPQQLKKHAVTLSLSPRSSRKNTLLCCLFYLPPVQQIITARHGDASQAP
jgi:hypothetical protein